MTDSTGYDGMWLPLADDPRTQGNPQGELATYREYLHNYRLTLRLKWLFRNEGVVLGERGFGASLLG